MRTRLAALAVALILAGVAVIVVPRLLRREQEATLRIPAGGADAVVTPSGLSWLGWELIDRATGKTLGLSANATTKVNYAESMIKAWIAADFLSRTSKAGQKLSDTDASQLKDMIVRSNDSWANHYFEVNGGAASVTRMDTVCGLGMTPIADEQYPWSTVQFTPSQVAHLGECIANGTAAGPYTSDLLKWMTEVQGGVDDQPDPPYGSSPIGAGRWGIIDGLPADLASQASIKNGWEPENLNHEWNINCLAILPHQVLAVSMQYPWTTSNGSDSYEYADNLQTGADACASIARQLVSTGG